LQKSRVPKNCGVIRVLAQLCPPLDVRITTTPPLT